MEVLHHDFLTSLQLGPLVDSEHPQIKKGTIDTSFDEIFYLEILRRVSEKSNFCNWFRINANLCFLNHFIFVFCILQLQDYAECMGSEVRVILVPSIRDANHDFVFPQVILLLMKDNDFSLLNLVILLKK